MPWWKFWQRKNEKEETVRIVALNNPEFNASNKYSGNKITTSRYSALTFIPVNLFEQFHRFANLYFLLLIFLQSFGQISSLNPITSILPLLFVLSVTAVKDGVDDFRRHKSDKKVNNRKVMLLRNGLEVESTWENVVVGDIVHLTKDEAVTADMVVLITSEPTGFCLIETAELDGFAYLKVPNLKILTNLFYLHNSETNLKVRQATDIFSQSFQDKVSELKHFKCEVHCEPPNNNLNKFEGVLHFGPVSTSPDPGQFRKASLSNDNILLRGCTLRATEWVYGLVIFTGKDTKLMKNSGAKRHKVTGVDVFLNRSVIGIFISMLVCCFICSMYDLAWERDTGLDFQIYQPWEDFMPKNNIAGSFILRALMIFLSYFILLNTFVPVSLYVSVEVVRLAQSILITWDKDMWYEETDTAADVRNTSLSEELGQIQYLFSDKTGTLTQNVMTLNKCSINGIKFGDVLDPIGGGEIDPYEDPSADYPRLDLLRSITPDADPKFVFYDRRLVEAIHQQAASSSWCNGMIRHYFRLMALCSTVVPSRVPTPQKDGTTMLAYQAQSPDENALTSAARSFGYVLHGRSAESLTIAEPTGPGKPERKLVFPLLHLLDFDNVRKRMSVIVREPDTNRIVMYCKGADSSIFPVAASGQGEIIQTTTTHLHDFAAKGLRTLVFGLRYLSEEEFASWKKRCDEATSAIGDRDEKVKVVYKEIEKDFTIIGASAIEDKLQDGVPNAIKQLLSAGIRMWVLTGDKQETAINIGYSCNLLNPDTNLTVINDDDAATAGKVAAMLSKMHNEMEGAPYVAPPRPSVEKRKMTKLQRFVSSLPDPHDVAIQIRGVFTRDFLVKIGLLSDHTKKRSPTDPNQASSGDPTPTPMFALSITGNALDAILPNLNKPKKNEGGASSSGGNNNNNESSAETEDEEEPDEVDANNLTDLFVKVAGRCTTVICCRMTPLAKARVVELFRRQLKARTCSIGDGANDVPMIRSANIGVGIAGKEGLQAVLASDFALAQFRYLAKLLLVHGRWSYARMSKFVLYFLYKNLTFTFGHFIYAFYCGGTAQTAFDPLYVGLFNTIFTAVPCIVLGATDQDVSAHGSMMFPQLYEVGQSGRLLNLKLVILTFIDSVYSALCVFFVHYGSSSYNILSTASRGETPMDEWKYMASVENADLRAFAFTLGFTTLSLVTIRCAEETNFWTIWIHISLWGSLAIYWITMFGFDPLIYALFNVHYEYEGAQYYALSLAPTWLASFGAIGLACLPGIFLAFLIQCLNPTLTNAVRLHENDTRKLFIIKFYETLRGLGKKQSPPIITVKPASLEHQPQLDSSLHSQAADSVELSLSLTTAPDGSRRRRRRPKRPTDGGSVSFRASGTGYSYSHTEGFGDLLTGHTRGSIQPIYSTHL